MKYKVFAGKTIHKYILFEKGTNRYLYEMSTEDDDVEHLCSSYRINKDSIELYTDCFNEIIKICKEWLDEIQEDENVYRRRGWSYGTRGTAQ